MARWEPDARGRLEQAALDLFGEHGFESTTVAEIAGRAGLTERTFFRHYADKREVLFWGQGALGELLVAEVGAAPPSAAPIDVVIAAVTAAGASLEPRRSIAARRHAVISANPELRERELIKLASLSAILATALRDRGVDDHTASLTAEIGITVFKVAYERWVGERGRTTLTDLVTSSWADLRTVTGDA
jgi:AcrR family transcriptional regulator